MKKQGWAILLIILSLTITLFLIRLISPKQIDDLSPEIPCPEMAIYNPDILYVIPNYNDIPISKNKTWCNSITSLNKTIQIHGINHQPYREFLTQITQENMTFALTQFQDCFNQTPEKFKPPQLKISKENKILVEENNLTIVNWFNQLTHKVYHCGEAGKIKNKWIKIF